jgi:hypothetical protein
MAKRLIPFNLTMRLSCWLFNHRVRRGFHREHKACIVNNEVITAAINSLCTSVFSVSVSSVVK